MPHVRRGFKSTGRWRSWTWHASLELWLTSRQPFCAQKLAPSVIFRSGHSIQNRINCNWFCTLVQIMDRRFHSPVLIEWKECWWFSVACRRLANFVALVSDQLFRRHPKATKFASFLQAPDRGYCVYYPSNLFRNARSFKNCGICSEIPQL